MRQHPMNDGRVAIQGADGKMDGTVSIDLPETPLDLDYLPTPNVEPVEGRPEPQWDPSNGIQWEDLEALGIKAVRIAAPAVAAGVATLALTGAVAPAAHAATSTGPASRPPAASQIVTTKEGTFATRASTQKTRLCVKMGKRVDRLVINGASDSKIAAAQRKEKKACRVIYVGKKADQGALPAGATGVNPDGTVRYGADWFREIGVRSYQGLSAKEQAQLEAAIDAVSGANYRDQSDLPPEQRVGFGPEVPAAYVAAAKNTPDEVAGSMLVVNIRKGDIWGDGTMTAIQDAEWTVVEGTNVTMVQYRAIDTWGGRTETKLGYDVSMPDGTLRGAYRLDTPQEQFWVLQADGWRHDTGSGGLF